MIPTRDLRGGAARVNDSAAASSSNSSSALNRWRNPMETCTEGIDPIRLAAELLEVPYLEVYDFKRKYDHRLIDEQCAAIREKIMRQMDTTITPPCSRLNVGELRRAASSPQRRAWPGGVAIASTAASTVEPSPDADPVDDLTLARLTRSVAALKKRTMEEINSLGSRIERDLASRPAKDFPKKGFWPDGEIWAWNAATHDLQSDALPVESVGVASKEEIARRTGSATTVRRDRLHDSFGVGVGGGRGEPLTKTHVPAVNAMRKRKRFLQGGNVGVPSQPSAGSVLLCGFIDPFGPVTRPTLKPEEIVVGDDSSDESPISFKPSQFE